jgi:cation diffusion facilitator family transporter
MIPTIPASAPSAGAAAGRVASLAAARAPWRAGLAAVAVGLVVLALKIVAALRTGSLALLADAAESVVLLVAALVASAAVRESERPAEGGLAFGHGKAEYLSAGIEGALVVLAAFVVAFEAIARFGQPPVAAALATGLGLSVLATAGNVLLARFLARVGRRHRSQPLLADAARVRADVVTSLAVYAGFGVAWASGWWRLDALLALGVSIHILIAGLRAVRHSVSGLMEETLGADELAAVETLLAAEGPPVVDWHDLETRRSGARTEVEVHLVVSRHAMLGEAREICDRLETGIDRLLPGAEVAIHVEPEGTPGRALSIVPPS